MCVVVCGNVAVCVVCMQTKQFPNLWFGVINKIKFFQKIYSLYFHYIFTLHSLWIEATHWGVPKRKWWRVRKGVFCMHSPINGTYHVMCAKNETLSSIDINIAVLFIVEFFSSIFLLHESSIDFWLVMWNWILCYRLGAGSAIEKLHYYTIFGDCCQWQFPWLNWNEYYGKPLYLWRCVSLSYSLQTSVS